MRLARGEKIHDAMFNGPADRNNVCIRLEAR